jgi:protein O-mannosyl-transferase
LTGRAGSDDFEELSAAAGAGGVPPAVRRGLVIVLLLGAASLHVQALGFDYVYDDHSAVVENPVLAGDDPGAVFATDYWGGRRAYRHVTTYRPLTSLTFWAERAAFGLSPQVSHGLNLLLYVLGVWMAFALLRAARVSVQVSWLSAAWFALMPVHVEAVVGVVNRAELLAFLSITGTALLWLKGLRHWALVSFGLGLLCKENTVTALPLLALASWLELREREARHWRRAVAIAVRLLPFASLVVGLLLIRGAVLPAVLGGDIPLADNPLIAAGPVGRALTPFKLFARALASALFPVALSPDYTLNAIPIAHLGDPAAWTGVAALGALTWAAWVTRRRVPELAAGLAWFLVTWSIVSNLPFLSTILYSDRGLYTPSLGLALMVAAVLERGARGMPRRWIAFALIAPLLGAQALGAVRYAHAWRTDRALFERAVTTTPESGRAHANLGWALMDEDPARAEEHLRRALEIHSDDFVARVNLGAMLVGQRRVQEAERELRDAQRRAPGYAEAHINLANLLIHTGRPREALEAARRASARAPDMPTAWENHGAAALQSGEAREGIRALAAAIRAGHANPQGILRNLAGVARASPALWPLMLQELDPRSATALRAMRSP